MRILSTITNPFKRSLDLDNNQSTKDLRFANRFFYIFLTIGFGSILWYTGITSTTATPVLWGLACLISGAALGFLFGIPRVLQDDGIAIKGTDEDRRKYAMTYRQQVNTNLTEISDWLTKIIIGLGLINLAKIPPYLDDLANALAIGLDQETSGDKVSFAYALIVFFSILGFLFGYLSTRLYLAGAFSRADQEAIIIGNKIRNQVNESAQQVLSSNPNASGEVTEDQLDAAERVERIAIQGDLSVVKKQILDLAKEYESLRESMPSGDARTRQMEIVITKMRTLALAGYSFLSELANSQSPGERLVAIAMLQVKPMPIYFDWLAERISVEKPFVGYHAAVALLHGVRNFGAQNYDLLQKAVDKAYVELARRGLRNSDRSKILENAKQELQMQSIEESHTEQDNNRRVTTT